MCADIRQFGMSIKLHIEISILSEVSRICIVGFDDLF